MKIHSNFKSIDSTINNGEMMHDYLNYALINQKMFIKKTTPWEMNKLFKLDELNSFNINLEKVDRLYYIYRNIKIKEYSLIARVDYNNRHLYVELYAQQYTDIWEGFIFISYDVHIFMKLVLLFFQNKNLIYQSLREDGIVINKEPFIHRLTWNDPPNLEFLCYCSIYQNKDILEKQIKYLPKILENKIKNFIKYQEVIDTNLIEN